MYNNHSAASVWLGKIADKTLEQPEREGIIVFPEIIRDTKDFTKEQMVLQTVNDTFRSENVRGFSWVWR